MIDGKRLRELREAHGFSREKFALEIGLGSAQIARYEREENDATGEILERIATFFNVSVDYLLGRTDVPALQIDMNFAPDEIALIDARRRGDLRAAMKILAADE